MLTEEQKACCRNLLNDLKDLDLQCLSQTVTQNCIAVSSRKEAIDAIIQCSESADELLHRQKLKKDHLKSYLIKHGDKSLLPSVIKSDKESLIKLVIESWTRQSPDVSGNEMQKAAKEEESTAQEIAVSFVSWFYQMLNAVSCELFPTSDGAKWGAHHFWDDAALSLQIEKPDGILADELQGSQQISERLFSFVWKLQGSFNPNMSSKGIFGELNRHGLLAIKSAGTFHRGSAVVGLYEQVFGLIQDPLTGGNWKIKNTKLRMKINLNDQESITHG